MVPIVSNFTLSEGLGELTNLKTLYMRDCTSLVSLPERFGECKKLEKLFLNGCKSLVSLPAGSPLFTF